MNGNEDLPGDHFWDAEEAEQEYYALGRALAEVEERQEKSVLPVKDLWHLAVAMLLLPQFICQAVGFLKRKGA
jgi:hypothetical protein